MLGFAISGSQRATDNLIKKINLKETLEYCSHCLQKVSFVAGRNLFYELSYKVPTTHGIYRMIEEGFARPSTLATFIKREIT